MDKFEEHHIAFTLQCICGEILQMLANLKGGDDQSDNSGAKFTTLNPDRSRMAKICSEKACGDL